jgi:hypothetical protein
MKIRRKTLVILGVAATVTVAALAFAGVVIAAQFSSPPDPESLAAATRSAPMIPLAAIEPGNGKPARGVFAQVTSTGQLCIWDAPSARSPQKLGGCNSIDDPLGGHLLSASLAYDGGPATRDVTDARLIGIAGRNVSSVQVLMGDGARLTMRLRPVDIAGADYWAFGYRFKSRDFESGVGPKAVVALDAGGREIDRQPTGFGG